MLKRLMAGLIVAVGFATPAAAHPHAWIDTTEEVVFDAQGRMTAIREHWLFDDFYTAATVKETGHGDNIATLVARLIHNLGSWSYFTRVHVDGKAAALAPPTEQSGRMVGNRLEMTFQVPLAQPVEIGARTLTYAVYDPTYFIEMLHAETPRQVVLQGAPKGCAARVVQPKPDPKAVARAAALDRTQSGGDGLGLIFAETVEIRCAAQE